MKKRTISETKKRNGFFATLCFAVIFLTLMCIHITLNDTRGMDTRTVNLDEDWTITGNRFYYAHVNLNRLSFPQVKEGDYICYSCKLPDVDYSSPVLTIYTIHSDVEVSIDGECIYRYGQEDYDKGKLVGYGYHFINLPSDFAGKELKISSRVRIMNAFTNINTPTISNGVKTLRDMIVDKKILLAINLFLIVFGICIMCVSIYFMFYNKSFMKPLCSGAFSIGVAAWSICIYDLIIFFTYNPAFKVYMEFSAIFFTPIPFMLYFWDDLHRHVYRKIRIIYDALVLIQTVFTVTIFILQIFNIVDMPEVLWIEHILLLVMFLFMIAVSIVDIMLHRFKYKALIFGMAVMIVTGVLDIIAFNIQKYVVYFQGRHFTSMISIGVLLFVLGQIVDFCGDIKNTLYENAETEMLAKMAYTDSLTGIANRRKCEEEFDKLDATGNDYGILAFDLNKLKETNDSKGHEQGDLLIMEFASVINRVFSSSAIVGRMGGDEFVVIIPDMSKYNLEGKLYRMHEQIAISNEIAPDLDLSVAYGFCRRSEYIDMDVKSVYRKADARMYDMKLSMKYSSKAR